jgi:hypothetical protein
MSSPLDSVISSLLEEGRRMAVATVAEGEDASLVMLQFADQLRKAADRLCQESAEAARVHGASWRLIGEAVGGITPQGAEHRFSRAAKERRSKASKTVWAEKERRAPASR